MAPGSHPGSPRDSSYHPSHAPSSSITASTSTAASTSSAGGKARKRPPSCNLCRIRKVKCIRDEPTARCESCIALNRTCEYGPSRRPGPVSRYARQPTPEQGDMDLPRPSSSYHHHPYDPTRSSRSPPPRSSRDPAMAYSAYPPPPPLPHSHSMPYPPMHGHSHHSSHPPPPHGHTHNPYQSQPPGGPSQGNSHQVTPSTSDQDRRLSSHSNSTPGRHGSFDFPLHPSLHGAGGPGSGGPTLPPISGNGAAVGSGNSVSFDPAFSSFDNSASAVDWLGLPISPYSSMLYSAGLGENLGPSPQRTTYSAASAEQTGGSMGPPSAPMNGAGGRAAGAQEGRKESSRHTSVEDVVAWSVVMRILDAYHINLYPLMPIVHWPSFLQLLISREDERNVAWRAMLFSLIAYSIIQLPRPVLSFIDVRDLRRLHQKCHALSYAQRNHEFATISVVDLTTLYCEHIYLSTMGRQNAANGILAHAIRMSQALNLHDERLDPEGNHVEREVRRRIFWLLYGSDRTISALTGCPLHISESDIHIPLPLAVDDNLITISGAFPQSPHVTSVLAGFHYASRLFHLLGAVLTAQHSLPVLTHSTSGTGGAGADEFAAPHLPPMQAPVRPAIQFQDALEAILADLPEPLRLKLYGQGGDGAGGPAKAPGAGGAGGAARGGAGPSGPDGHGVSAGMVKGSSNTGSTAGGAGGGGGSSSGAGAGGQAGVPPPSAAATNAFEICKANLLVSQAMVRFAIQQYAVGIGENWDDLHGREWTEKNVLQMLESMSSESLAANGESLRHKILSFVASSFLDRYPGTSENHTLFLEFLGLYDRIREVQQTAELEAPESRMPSRAATPAGMAMSSMIN